MDQANERLAERQEHAEENKPAQRRKQAGPTRNQREQYPAPTANAPQEQSMTMKELATAVMALCFGTIGGVMTWMLLFLAASNLNLLRDPIGSLVILGCLIAMATAVPTFALAGWLPAAATKRLALGYLLAGLAAAAWFIAIFSISPPADASGVTMLCIEYLLIAPVVVLSVAHLKLWLRQTASRSNA